MRKYFLLCGLAAMVMVSSLTPVARAHELRNQEKVMTENDRWDRGRDGRRRPPPPPPPPRWDDHRHGGNGWAWAGLGAIVGLGVLAAVTSNNDDTVYVQQPATTYVYPGTTTYVQPAPTTTYSYPAQTYSYPTTQYPAATGGYYTDPNTGQTYYYPAGTAAPGATYQAPAPTYNYGGTGFYTN